MMKVIPTIVVALATVSFSAIGIAQTQSKGTLDVGKREYQSKCMVCHGPVGKGDGSYGELLKKPATDLTILKKNNGGVFPVERLSAVIDGREHIKEHGEREMPIWGRQYGMETAAAAEHYVDVPYYQEMFVRARILALIDYLNRLQAK